MDLFFQSADAAAGKNAPLAERMRPRALSQVAGQEHVTGPEGLLGRAVEKGRLFSMIFWGPPGCGKTTLARIVTQETDARFLQFSAVGSGVKQIREVAEKAREFLHFQGKKTVLFVDEIHRFNKAQQDGFLPHVESGLITLIGATTENPSFEVNAPLLSRCRVVVLKALTPDAVRTIVERALADSENGLGNMDVALAPEAAEYLAALSDGDARVALNTLEVAVFLAEPGEDGARRVTQKIMAEALQKKGLVYDKAGEGHYNLISALHKSLRDSDPDGALYWLARMLDAGEDPLYLVRRMMRFASEDVGNADPHALTLAVAAMQSYHFLGSPEGELALYQLAAYLAVAPKSNALYMAEKSLKKTIRETGSLPVPLHIRNAPTGLMKELGYGKGYQYAHDFEGAAVDQEHLPDELAGRAFYHPTTRGFEKTVAERIRRMRELKDKAREKK